jgi:hypothetical protein
VFEELRCAGVLRPIGQALEKLGIESFSVWPDGSGFMVRDRTRNLGQITARGKALSSDRQTTDRAPEAIEDVLRLATGVVEWRLDRSDIEKLESAGRERRCSSNQTPDPHATSQVLRATGEIVDQRLGRLLRITKEGHIVNLNYLSSSGQTVSDDYSPATLYDFWVRMYKKRSSIDSSVLE